MPAFSFEFLQQFKQLADNELEVGICEKCVLEIEVDKNGYESFMN